MEWGAGEEEAHRPRKALSHRERQEPAWWPCGSFHHNHPRGLPWAPF